MSRTRRRRQAVLAALLLVLVGACRGGFEKHLDAAARAVLLDADEIEILALEPLLEPLSGPVAPDLDVFHGYPVRGRARVLAPDDRARVVALVRRGIDAADDRAAACFAPRHGLRALRDGRSLDLVICYECLRIRVFGADGARAEVPTASNVEPEISELFRAHGLAIATH